MVASVASMLKGTCKTSAMKRVSFDTKYINKSLSSSEKKLKTISSDIVTVEDSDARLPQAVMIILPFLINKWTNGCNSFIAFGSFSGINLKNWCQNIYQQVDCLTQKISPSFR